MSEEPGKETFWTGQTRLLLILLSATGVAFLVGLLAITSINLVR